MPKTEVRVANQNTSVFSDSWHGLDFKFEPGEKVVIPLEAAVHIFGFNLKDKTKTMIRLGISNHPDGEKWLGNFRMQMVEYVAKDERVAPAIDQSAAKIKELEAANAQLQTANQGLQNDLDTAVAKIKELEGSSKKK